MSGPVALILIGLGLVVLGVFVVLTFASMAGKHKNTKGKARRTRR